MKLSTCIESLLFVSQKPLSVKKLALQLGVSMATIEESLAELHDRLEAAESGLTLIRHNSEVQLATNSNAQEMVSNFLREEVRGELSRSATETLSIIAYRGPLKKEDIEHIRGVNCSISLRNLLVRGLIVEKKDPKGIQSNYSISIELLRHLGLSSIDQLPSYDHFKSLTLCTDEAPDTLCAT